MESIFNLNNQNSNLDNKIVAGLDRISQVFKTLLWGKSKTYNLSLLKINYLFLLSIIAKKKQLLVIYHKNLI